MKIHWCDRPFEWLSEVNYFVFIHFYLIFDFTFRFPKLERTSLRDFKYLWKLIEIFSTEFSSYYSLFEIAPFHRFGKIAGYSKHGSFQNTEIFDALNAQSKGIFCRRVPIHIYSSWTGVVISLIAFFQFHKFIALNAQHPCCRYFLLFTDDDFEWLHFALLWKEIASRTATW